MRDLSKILSVFTIAGILAVGGMTMAAINPGSGSGGYAPPALETLVQPVGILEVALNKTPDNYTMHGSGVFVTPTHFLTAGHVLDMITDKTTGRIRMENGDIYNVVSVQKFDGFDAGYVVVDKPYKGFIPKVNCANQPRGTELINVGSPLELEFIESKLMVTGGEMQKEPPAVQPLPDDKTNFKLHKPGPDTNPPAEDTPKENINTTGTVFFQGLALPGQSGSPVYDKNGEVVGVLIITIVDPKSSSYSGLGLYVSTNAMCSLVDGALK